MREQVSAANNRDYQQKTRNKDQQRLGEGPWGAIILLHNPPYIVPKGYVRGRSETRWWKKTTNPTQRRRVKLTSHRKKEDTYNPKAAPNPCATHHP